jgi:hypothetical protein
MKKYFAFLPAALLLLSACSNDFDVAAPWKDIPVVYGIISPLDTAAYIRVEKAFLDPNTSAFTLAQIPDSIYYDDNQINVFLERSDNGQRVQMQRVDGNLEGYVRDTGIFAPDPNWLYKYKSPASQPFLVGLKTYKLVVERGDQLPAVTGETTLPGTFKITTPSANGSGQYIINFTPNGDPAVEWRTDGAGVLFEVKLAIRFRETGTDGSFLGRDTLLWTAVQSVRRTDNTSGQPNEYRGKAILSTTAFYQFLANNIAPASSRLRYFEGCNIILTGGGAEIAELQEVLSANSGISGAEALTTYTNMSEGFGIFTGRNTAVLPNVVIGPATVTSMNEDPLTKPLNFRN